MGVFKDAIIETVDDIINETIKGVDSVAEGLTGTNPNSPNYPPSGSRSSGNDKK